MQQPRFKSTTELIGGDVILHLNADDSYTDEARVIRRLDSIGCRGTHVLTTKGRWCYNFPQTIAYRRV